MSDERVLVIVPTYNEKENLPLIVGRIRAATPDVHILVADDNSPDGTGQIADELVAADDHVHVMHRMGKEGLGAAYLAGFAWALENNYDVVVEMDADGSHPGGQVRNWPKSREFLSRGGNTYTRIMLGLPLRDATGGYRAFRASALRALQLDQVASQGYCFQVDLAWRASQMGLRVKEVPITFVEREIGASKMSRHIVVEALWRVTQWGTKSRYDKIKTRVGSRSSR